MGDNVSNLGNHKHIKGSKERYLLGQDKTSKFLGYSPLSSCKTTLKQQLNGQKRKMKWEAKSVICFRSSYAVFLSSAWENVGMTMMCNRCDVMNILWHKTQMAQKSDRERWAGGVGGGMTFGIWILGGGGGEGPTWKRKKASSFKHPRGWMGKPEYWGGKTPLVRCSKNPVMSVLISSHSCFIGGRGRGHHSYWYQHKECSVLFFGPVLKTASGSWILD